MGLDADLTSILRDMVQFLECLRDTKLPESLESVRGTLLLRSRDTLTMLVTERMGRPGSPEPYLNMNAAGSKGLMATLRKEAELEEYVGAEEHQQLLQKQQQQDYYETFHPVESGSNPPLAIHESGRRQAGRNEPIENALVDIYASFSAAQTRSKCQMCGSLYRKEGKKLFVFEQYRACWVGLVGFHLLIYGNDRDSRPCTVLPIRGYMARAAPNAVPRDQRRSESTFEIFRPGSRTFQFIARTPKDMKDWVTKICDLGGEGRTECRDVSKIVAHVATGCDNSKSNDREDSDGREERYQDVGPLLGVEKQPEEQSTFLEEITGSAGAEADESASKDACPDTVDPSLPPSSSPSVSSDAATTLPPTRPTPLCHPSSSARVPRQLPSLPVPRASFQFLEEEEDDIYHKIEDFRDAIHYGNIGETFPAQPDEDRTSKERVTYDDVRANVRTGNGADERRNRNGVEDTYDDTAIPAAHGNKSTDHREKFVSHCDVQITNAVPAAKTTKARATEKPEAAGEPAKSPQKKSFLDRVRSRRESPKKVEKKDKRKTPPPSALTPPVNRESGTYYDDVSDLMNLQPEVNRFEIDQSEYTCPPPPRPVYTKPQAVPGATDSQEFYDDVAAYRDRSKNDADILKSDQLAPKSSATPSDTDPAVSRENTDYSPRSLVEEDEHYKTPRVEARYSRGNCVDQQVEDLYDDIAILADFTARQKEILTRKDGENATRSHGSQEKKSWNRFVGGKKLKTVDVVAAETCPRHSHGSEDSADDFSEQQGPMRKNTLQKLISKMENSLGKASSRSATSVHLGKTSATSNV